MLMIYQAIKLNHLVCSRMSIDRQNGLEVGDFLDLLTMKIYLAEVMVRMFGQNDDPVRKIFKQVLILSLLVMIILVVIAFFMSWSILQMLGGFWIGVMVNLISFRLIIMSADRIIEAGKSQVQGIKRPRSSGFLPRFVLYAISLYLIIQFGDFQAIIGFAVGISMIALTLKLEAFFPKKGAENSTEES